MKPEWTSNRCRDGGYLVGAKLLLPDDPTDYCWRGRIDVAGCNRLHCPVCDSWVRSRPGFHPRPTSSRPRWMEVYRAEDWAAFSWLERGPDVEAYRLYVCWCRHAVERGADPLDKGEPMAEQVPWRCGGHEPAALPLSLDGVEIGRATALEPLLVGWWQAEDDEGIRLADRLWGRLAGTGLQLEVERVAASCMLHPSPLVRARALAFHHVHPEAAGAPRLLELARGDRRSFAGVPDPFPTTGGPDLEARLLLTIGEAFRVGALDGDEVRALLRAEALGGKARPVVATLAARDKEWFVDHVVDILRASPGAAGRLLVVVHRHFMRPALDVVALAHVARATSGVDLEEARREVETFIYGEPRGELLAILGDGPGAAA